MDFHTRRALKIYLQPDGQFHHSPSHDPADVLCDGSDSEQTEDEIQRKRSRYEQHAERYMRGFMPIIQSARLRGPFAQSNGWSNPWQHEPPSPILTHDTSVRANDKIERQDGEASSISMVESPSGTVGAIVGLDSSAWVTEADTTQRSRSHSRTSANKQSYTQATNGFILAPADRTSMPRGRMMGAKRPLDAQWLKGSYVSKRARWEDSDLATPTPNPQTVEPESQIRRASLSKLGFSSDNQQSSSPNCIAAFRDIPRGFSQRQHRESHLASRNITRADSPTCASYTPEDGNSQFDNSSQRGRNVIESPQYQSTGPLLSISQQPRPKINSVIRGNKVRTPNDYSFVTEIVPASQNLEEFQFRKKRPKSRNTGLTSDPPRHRTQLQQSKSATKSSSNLTQNGSSRLPDPQQQNIQPRAPSMEELQNDESRSENHVLHVASLDEVERHSDEDTESVLNSKPLNDWYQSASIKSSQSPEDAETASENEKADRSWSKIAVEVASEKASPCQTDDGLNNCSPSQQFLVEKGDSRFSLCFTADSCPFSPQQSKSSHGHSESVCSQSLPLRREYLQEEHLPITGRLKTFEGMGIHDFSTQSYNTTPARSSRLNALRISPTKSGHINKEPTEGIFTQERRENGSVKLLVSPTAGPKTQRPDTSCADKQENFAHNSLNVSSNLRRHLASSGRQEDVQLSMETEDLSIRNHQEDPSAMNVTVEWTISSGFYSNSDVVNSMSVKTPRKHSPVISPTKQSPWATVDVPPLIDTNAVLTLSTANTCNQVNTSSSNANSPSMIMMDVEGEDSEWQPVEHPMTPVRDNGGLHNDTIAPCSPYIEPGEVQGKEPLLDTQQLVEAAIANPWTKSPTRKPSKKSGKRVSFAILFDDGDDENEQVEVTKRTVHSPPPPASSDGSQGETLEDIVPSFKKHFSSLISRRRPLSQESLSARSPAVSAMAEAFLEADRNASLEQERRQASSKSSRHLKPSSEAMVNSALGNSLGLDALSSPNLFEHSPTRETQANIGGSDFDMEEVLGEVADFLGDWSVDSDLQKYRKGNSASSMEDNGTKRRRLFGIL